MTKLEYRPDKSITSILNFLNLITILWLCKRISLFLKLHVLVLRVKGNNVCNLRSNDSGKKSNINIYLKRGKLICQNTEDG